MSGPTKPAGGPVIRRERNFKEDNNGRRLRRPGNRYTLGPGESVDAHQSLAHTDWHQAITSRDIDALVQLKLLRKAL